ncbi:MAG: succinylglutamate desuccinylase [Proteobacteria bacterium]|nr:succinylglutamate desuccinylase [Pseudomonadota bacterium]
MINHLHIETHSFFGLKPGPNVLILGRVHGNECCGTLAINHVINLIQNQLITITLGKVTFVPITNPLAAIRGTRNGDRNLNRAFYPKGSTKSDFEDELNNILCPILEECDILLDLHSFLNGVKPFALIGNTSKDEKAFFVNQEKVYTSESRLVSALEVDTVIANWSETYARGVQNRRKRDGVLSPPFSLNYDEKYGDGTTEYARSKGALAITLECGQHEDVFAPRVGQNAILNILSHLRMTNERPNPVADNPKVCYITLFDVIDKISHGDKFTKNWKTFMKIMKNEIIGISEKGKELRAPKDCFMVFPNQNAEPGQEWFYLGEES